MSEEEWREEWKRGVRLKEGEIERGNGAWYRVGGF